MVAQTSYALTQGKAYVGQIFDLNPSDRVSRAVETVAGIEFGLAVSRGTNKDTQVVLGGTDFLGISYRSLEREGAANTGETLYAETETAGILRSGYIWVTLPAGGNPGDAIKYIQASGVVDVGAPGAGETAIANATLETVTVAGEIGVVRIGV